MESDERGDGAGLYASTSAGALPEGEEQSEEHGTHATPAGVLVRDGPCTTSSTHL